MERANRVTAKHVRMAEQLSTVNAISDALARTKRVQTPPELTAIKNRQAVALLSDALASVAGLERIVGKRQIAQVRRVQALVAEARAEIPARRKCEGRTPRPGRAPRRATNGRRQGSRRATGTGTRAGPSDDDGESEPPRLRLWRHPHFGSCSPALLRVLIGAGS